MEFNSLAILLTEDCNARCKMCCDKRGLVKGETFTKENLEMVLQKAKEYKYITHIGITGGEPMLYPELCEFVLNYPFDREMTISIKTNGFWGSNRERAENFIERNKDKLSVVSFSYDEFHKEFIDLNHIKSLIDITQKYKIRTDIVGCFLKGGVTPGDILNELGEYAYLTVFHYQPVVNTGSAELFEKEQFIKLLDTEKHDINCMSMVRDDLTLTVIPNLDVFPCCSQMIENTILKIGSYKNETTQSLVDQIQHNKIFYTIFKDGFKPYIDILKEKNIPYPQQLSSHCEMCEYLFKDEWFLEMLNNENYYSNL